MTNSIIDSDRHVTEPLSMWRDYLPSKYADYAPTLVSDTREELADRMFRLGEKGAVPLLPEIHVDGRPLFNNWSEALRIEASKQSIQYNDLVQSASNPKSQLKSMDESGISMAHLFPTYATYIVNNELISPDVSTTFATSYNNWLYDYCREDRARLRGVGLISRHDHKSMTTELDRVHNYGWKSVVLRPEKILGKTLGHNDYERFWSKCEEMEIGVAIHGGTHLHAPTIGSDRFGTRFSLHACSHPFEAQMAFLTLLESGVLERHSKLKIAFLEAGASWVPHWLWRLDEICYQPMPGEVAHHIKMKPSEYFMRQCWVGFEIGEPCLPQVVSAIGGNRLLYGTDFPHPDHLQFDINKLESDVNGLSSEIVKLALVDNPKQFFGTE